MLVDLSPRLPPRVAPARHPMRLPTSALIPIIDTNLLLTVACSAARAGHRENLISALSMTGRANPHVGAHVPGELVEHLPRVAAKTHADPAVAEAILWRQVMPRVPVVGLAIRDLLGPRTRQIMGDDADDVETMALAELLAPAVILSSDKVFAKFGHAGAAIRAIEHATAILRAAGIEATYSDGLNALELTATLGFHGAAALLQTARRHPFIAGGSLAVLAITAIYHHWHRADRWKHLGHRLVTNFVEPAAELVSTLAQTWSQARDGLVLTSLFR